MQTKSLQYTKQQLLDSFKKKQNDKIRELIMQETGVDLFTELPQEAVNKQQDQLELNLNQGFFKNKKGFINKNNNNNSNFRGDNNNNKFSNDFKRGPLNNKNQESGDGMRFNRKNQGSQQTQQVLKELIPVFQDCGFIKDPTIEVWYYKESEDFEGPFNSVDMDNMLFANKVNFETKVAFKDPEEKYVRIKKLIQLTYEDKYNHLFVQQKPANNDENNNQRRPYYKKEFTGSNEENTNFSRGVPRFTKQTSDNNNANANNQQSTAITRPQFTRTISDTKNQNTTEVPQVNSKKTEQSEVSKQQEPQKNTVEQQKPQELKEETQTTAATKVKASKEAQKTPTVSQSQNKNEDKLQQSQEQQKTVQEEKQTKPSKDNKKQSKEVKEQKQEVKEQKQEPKQEVKAQVDTKIAANTATSTKQTPLVQLPVQQEQNLEGFQVIPSKQAGKKKFDKKNATKILVTGLSEQEIQEEENRKRLEEIRQRDLIQQQKFAEQQAKAKEQEQPQKKLDYFDDESKVEEIIGQEESFPTLGQPSTSQKKNQLVSNNKKQPVKPQNDSDEDEDETEKQEQIKQVPISKTGNKLVKGGQAQNKNDKKQVINNNQQNLGDDWIVTDKNSKKKQNKRTQEESDEEYERQQAIINEQARQERLKKQKEQEEKQRQLELQQQEERRKIEEFQRRQQFGDQDYHSESEEEIDPSDEKSFPSLGGQAYNGPPKKNQNQQNKTKGKFNTTAQSKALYNYVKTLEENAWDIQPKKQPTKQSSQPQQKSKQNHINNDDFPSL
ncbi:hypothetical protein ABPG74_022029 [Tetrahymena malaccensis]